MLLGAVCALLLAAPMVASAATPSSTTGTSLKNVPVTGTGHNGKAFKGHFTVTQFVTRGGKTYAFGTLTGDLGSRSIKKQQVELPAQLPSGKPAGAATTCPVLHLILGPLSLHLLGLNVHLNQVILNITATSGPGNRLGSLLYGVSNLLNSSSPVGSTLTGRLNIVQQLLNTPALLNL